MGVSDVYVIFRDGILSHINAWDKAIIALKGQTEANFCAK
jgi:hypothetical protein